MDAPKCQNFPSCGKSHYGPCGSGATGARSGKAQARSAEGPDRSAKRPVRAKKKSSAEKRAVVPESLEARVEALEFLVDELLAGKRKRSAYMREYQRARRAKEKG